MIHKTDDLPATYANFHLLDIAIVGGGIGGSVRPLTCADKFTELQSVSVANLLARLPPQYRALPMEHNGSMNGTYMSIRMMPLSLRS